MTAPALRALRPAATTSAFAGDGLRPQAPAPSRVAATSRTRDMAVRVRTVARRAPPRVAAGARDPRVSIAPEDGKADRSVTLSGAPERRLAAYTLICNTLSCMSPPR